MTSRFEKNVQVQEVETVDNKGDEEEEDKEITFEPFEPGNPWTQKLSTQVQRRIWRKQVYLEEEGKDDDSATIKPLKVEKKEEEISSRPWWSKGKTAPLLNDFDSNLRSFYLVQAGIGSKTFTESGSSHSHQGIASSSTTTTTSKSNEAHRVLTLAGKANSPIDNSSTSSITVTPKKKTWDATWNQDGQRSVGNNKLANTTTTPNTNRSTSFRATRERTKQTPDSATSKRARLR